MKLELTGEERRKGRLMEGHVNYHPLGGMANESRCLHTGPRRPEAGKPASPDAWLGPRPALTNRKLRDSQPTWRPKEYQWVVEIGGQIVGEIRLVHDSQHTALLRHLRIDPAWQRTAALSRLIECVRQFCWNHGRLRLNLEPGCAPRWMLHVLRRRGLQFSSRWQTGGKDIWAPQPMVDRTDKSYHLPS